MTLDIRLAFTFIALMHTSCALTGAGRSSGEGETSGQILRTIETSQRYDANGLPTPTTPLRTTTTFDGHGREIRVEQVDVDGPGSFLLCTAHLNDGSEVSVLWEGFEVLAPDVEREIERSLAPPRENSAGVLEVTARDAYYGSDPENLAKTAEYAFDEMGRMVRRIYFRRSSGEPYAEDIIRYDERDREIGYTSRRLDGSRETEYRFEYDSEDGRGHWTRKSVFVDGKLARKIERDIVRATVLD